MSFKQKQSSAFYGSSTLRGVTLLSPHTTASKLLVEDDNGDDNNMDDATTASKSDVSLTAASTKHQDGDCKKQGDQSGFNSQLLQTRTKIIMISSATFAIAVMLAIVFLLSQTNNFYQNEPKGDNHKWRLEAIRSVLLEHEVSGRQQLLTKGTAQYKALDWLANNDPAHLSALISGGIPPENIINRYIVAVIYFQNNCHRWKNQLNFLSEHSIWEWQMSDSVEQTGVLCNSSTIVQLDLGENMTPYFLM